jgi:hypothetical protein
MIEATKLNNNVYSSIINDTNKKIINNVFSNIKDANKNNTNKVLYELPFYFENLLDIIENDIITIGNLRILIWGNVIESLTHNGFSVTIDIDNSNEKCFILVKWPTSLDKYTEQIDKYNDLIKKCVSSSS